MITKKIFWGVDTGKKRSIISLVALERGKHEKRETPQKSSHRAKW